MLVQDILKICDTNTFIMIEDAESSELLYEGMTLMLHGKLRKAIVEWLRPYKNGIALKIKNG